MKAIRFAAVYFETHRNARHFTLLGLAAMIAGTITASHATQGRLADDRSVTPSRAPYQSRILEDRELQRIHEAARERVQALAANLQSLPDGPESRAIQQQISETKRQAYIGHLEVILASARDHGDEATVLEAEKMLAHLNQPPQPAAGSGDFIQGPDKGAP